jgi:BirA family biotin operon repressor/biotin-[acetyl-CoA-carboxylase] ligase
MRPTTGTEAATIQPGASTLDGATAPPFVARLERFERVGSTNDVVRDRLAAGEREVCIAVAGEQTAGRGREGRTWTAPPGAALLCSLGFRPTYLAPDRAWRLAAIVALAMADAAEDAAGLPEGTIRLKWPNDLVVVAAGEGMRVVGDVDADAARALRTGETELRKLGGILGETSGMGTDAPTAVVGIGVNADWRAAEFPPGIASTMTSLHEVSGGRPIDRDALLEGFLDRLETRLEALRGGRFDVAGWAERQVTSGHLVQLETPDGRVESVRAVGVDGASGALLIAGIATDEHGTAERAVHAGEIGHLRLGSAVRDGV